MNYRKYIGSTALHLAAENGDFQINNRIRNSVKMSKLFRFFCIGHDNAVKVLIELGAKVNSKDNNGLTPLDYAVKNGDFKLFASEIQSKSKSKTSIFRSPVNGSIIDRQRCRSKSYQY